MIVNYHREALNQAGAGHHSPIGAYNEATDQVLILDVARFKYPPHWVELAKLYEAMKDRGWMVLSRPAEKNYKKNH